MLSLGCHSGLSVPDDVIGGGPNANDVPAALAARGAAYLAVTGFGYGDQNTVGLHERLMAFVAGNLDGTLTLGDAVIDAKQRYFATQGLYGNYDEKVLGSTVLYGFPMWRIGDRRPPRARRSVR